MSEPAGHPVRCVLRRLFSGARGAEVLADLDREYAALRSRVPRGVAWSWYLLQLLRPATWQLAWALQRIAQAEDASVAGRDRRGGQRGLSGLSLDLKLAWRMLAKSPGVTVVGVLGIALGTAVGVGFFVVLSSHLYPKLPLPEGDRIVALRHWDVGASSAIGASPQDFLRWRAELRTVEELSAVAMGSRALVTGDAPPRPVHAAAMTATGFKAARVQPLIGRYLLAEDEAPGAARVVVLGYDVWQRHFEGDPRTIGRSVLLGRVQHTVVGVMPPGFAFPKNQEAWTALHHELDSSGQDAELFVFGRLAPGATRVQAQAEIAAIGQRAVADQPDTDRQLRAEVVPFTYPLDNIQVGDLWQAARIQLMVSLLLIAIAVNMAVLVYTRTAMRQGEIALRSALGASRGRIVVQLLVETFVLSALGAALGLAVAYVGLAHFEAIVGRVEGVGFWVDYGIRPGSVLFALALAVVTAIIVGVVPALKSTGRGLGADLRSMGSGASMRLGRAWTVLIVAQVAIAVTVLPMALHLGLREVRMAAVRPTFPAHEFLTADVGMAVPLGDGMDAAEYQRAAAARFADRLPELERRVQADPAVIGVTFEGGLPGRSSLIQIDGVSGPAEGGAHRIATSGVATGYFEVVGARILSGRELRSVDVGQPGNGVVVNEAFVRRVLGGGPALGHRVRFLAASDVDRRLETAPAGPWLDVVGVVEDLRSSAFDVDWAPPVVYYALAAEQLQSVSLLVRVRGGDTDGFAPRLRQIAAAVDPDFRLSSVGSHATLLTPEYLAMAVTILLLVLGTVLLLSAAGIHALMSLAVTRRRREIGIRTALGAGAGRVLASVFARAAWQLGLGGLLGSLLGGALLLAGGLAVGEAAPFLGGVIMLMLAAGLTAAAGPARRGLGIQPMEALREE
jgi:putative ABC transport system permease protein